MSSKFIALSLFIILFSVPVFAGTEIELAPEMQIDVTTTNFNYSYDYSLTMWWGLPVKMALMGLNFDYQDNFQKIGILFALRTLPADFPLKFDLIAGGGLASVQSPLDDFNFEYTYLTAGVEPILFFIDNDTMDGFFIYLRIMFTDLVVPGVAYSYVNASGGIGFYIW
jgi:hypothetical protein